MDGTDSTDSTDWIPSAALAVSTKMGIHDPRMSVTREHRDAARWVESQWIRLHSWTMMAYLGVAIVLLWAANVPLGAFVPFLAVCLFGFAAGCAVAHLNVRRVLTDPADYARLYRAFRRTRRKDRNPADFRDFLGEILNYILRTHRRDTLALVASGFTVVAIAAALGPLVAAFMLLSFYSALNLAWFVLKSKVLEPHLDSRSDEPG